MGNEFEFSVWCQSERKEIARIVLPRDKEIGVSEIVKNWNPIELRYGITDSNGKPLLKDGEQMLCPFCKNPILIREPDGSKGVYLVPGGFRTAA